jgi:hypothetical protein
MNETRIRFYRGIVVAAAVAAAGCGSAARPASISHSSSSLKASATENAARSAEPGHSSPTAAARRSAKNSRRLLLALPQLGRLTGRCGSEIRYRLRFHANSERSQKLRISVSGGWERHRELSPDETFSFRVPVSHHNAVNETPRIRLATSTTSEILDLRARARMRLAEFDGTGDCVARAMRVRANTHFHFG